jgi:hypothetical protein
MVYVEGNCVQSSSNSPSPAMLEEFFDRCPVLPVDATVSMARYAAIVRSTVSDASKYEKAGDADRATLLYMRCMILVCKTIPSHLEYSVRENKAIRRDLAGLAGICLEKLEAYASARFGMSSITRSLEKASVTESCLSPSVADPCPTSNPASEFTTTATIPQIIAKRPRIRALVVSQQLIALFQRIPSANSGSGSETIGVLAGRLSPLEDAGVLKTIESITQEFTANSVLATGGSLEDVKFAPVEVTALVMPSQRLVASSGNRTEAEILHETDVANLLAAKGLMQLGWILKRPDGDSPASLDSLAAHRQLHAQLQVPSATTIVVTPTRVTPLALSDPHGIEVVRACSVRSPHTHDGASELPGCQIGIDSESAGSSKTDASCIGDVPRVVVRAEHVTMCQDPESVQFKLYDVRSLALRHASDSIVVHPSNGNVAT